MDNSIFDYISENLYEDFFPLNNIDFAVDANWKALLEENCLLHRTLPLSHQIYFYNIDSTWSSNELPEILEMKKFEEKKNILQR